MIKLITEILAVYSTAVKSKRRCSKMRKYETIFILNPSLEEEAVKAEAEMEELLKEDKKPAKKPAAKKATKKNTKKAK